MNQILHFHNKNKSIGIFFLCALAIHFFLLVISIKSNSSFVMNEPNVKKIKLKMKKTFLENQIIDSVRPENKTSENEKEIEKEKDSKYLSDTNNTTKEETKAKTSTATNQGVIGKIKAKDLMDQFTRKKKVSTGSTSLSFNPDKIDLKNHISQELKVKKGNSEDKTGASSSSGILDDLKVADFTEVNTIKYKFHGYFKRLKSTLEVHWGSSLREKAKILFYKNIRIPASEDYLTKLRIIMDSFGAIEQVSVVTKSGVTALDQAAVEAFNKAGPFPNPPAGLVKNDKVKIEWGFIVKN